MKYPRFLTLIPVSLFALISCNNQEIKPTHCQEGDCSYFYQENKQIVVDSSSNQVEFTVEAGNQLVFTYEYKKDDSPRIADDEYTENLIFAIDSSLSDFAYTDDQLSSTDLAFIAYCFCIDRTTAITSGTLSGLKKDNNHWQIDLDVSFDRAGQTEQRTFSKVFTLKP